MPVLGLQVLVPAKLAPPQPRPGLVRRERLLAQLAARAAARLTLLLAPAGFGKSTLALQWLMPQPGAGATSVGPVAWLTLDEHDQDALRVLAYIAGAVERAVPGALTTALPMLAAPEPPPPHVAVQAMLVDLSALAGPLTLVLDDYHAVAAEPVHHIVAYLLRNLPPHCRVVLLGRADPPLPLVRLRAEHQLSELRAADLRFTEAEAAALLAALLGAEPASADVAALHRQTEGWAIALQLVALARRDGPPARSLGEGDGHLAEYMADEVFDRQPEEIQRALLAFAVPERFCAGLCAALLGAPADLIRAEILLEQLERENLLIIPLDAQRSWFRFHHLFRDLLLRRLRLEAGRERLRTLQLRAARWLADACPSQEAVRLYLAAGDDDAAGATVEQVLYRELGRDLSSEPPRAWLGLLPADLRARRPGLALIEARIAVVQMNLEGAAAYIARADALIAAAEAAGLPAPWPAFRGDLEVLRGTLDYWRGRPAAAIEALSAGLRHGPVQALATSGLLFLGRAYEAAGRSEEGLRLIGAPGGGALGAGVQVTEAMRHTALCMMHELAGRVDSFHREALSLGAALAALGARGSWATFAASYIGRSAYERSDLAAAAAHFAEVRARKYHTNAYNVIGCLIGMAMICLAQGAPADAEAYAEEARAYAAEVGGPFLRNEALGCAVHLALARGDLAAALEQAEQIAPDPMQGARAWYAIPPPQLSRARALIAAGGAGLALAEAAIDDLLAQVAAMHNLRPLVCALATRATLREAQGRPEEARADLGRAIGLAAPLGLVRTLVDCGPALRPLLEAAAARGLERAYIAGLLGLIDPAPAGHAPRALARPAPAPPGLLTRREGAILGLLATRLSDKEIAERLTIAPNTVRKHTSAIYGKLGVGSRREAVKAGRSLGLLPEA